MRSSSWVIKKHVYWNIKKASENQKCIRTQTIINLWVLLVCVNNCAKGNTTIGALHSAQEWSIKTWQPFTPRNNANNNQTTNETMNFSYCLGVVNSGKHVSVRRGREGRKQCYLLSKSRQPSVTHVNDEDSEASVSTDINGIAFVQRGKWTQNPTLRCTF